MAIDFSASTGAPDEAGETRNVRLPAAAPVLEPGAPTDLELMHGIQAEDPEALSALYDRYNGIIKALILRVIHNEAEADDLLQEIFMEIWNQAKNFSAQKGKPLGWMVTLARRRAIDGLRKKQAYARAGERLQSETEQQPDAWVHNARSGPPGDQHFAGRPAAGHKSCIFSRDESARNRGKNEYTVGYGQDPARIGPEKDLRRTEGTAR
jgi:RNA polymerase sigma factor (sigma-70 family)